MKSAFKITNFDWRPEIAGLFFVGNPPLTALCLDIVWYAFEIQKKENASNLFYSTTSIRPIPPLCIHHTH